MMSTAPALSAAQAAARIEPDVAGERRIDHASLFRVLRHLLRLDIGEWLDRLEAARVEAKHSSFHGHLIRCYYEAIGPLIESVYGAYWHFAPYSVLGQNTRDRNESLQALHRHFARLLRLEPGRRVLELGCGHGRLGRWLAQYSGAQVTGVTLGQHEAAEANAHAVRNHRVIVGDYHDLAPLRAAQPPIDAALAVYCLKYTTELDRVFGELYRTLPPGGLFLSYDIWLSRAYDPANPKHSRLHDAICASTCMPPLHPVHAVIERAEKAGLRLIYDVDLSGPRNPWYRHFYEAQIVQLLDSRLISRCVRLLGAFKPHLAEMYESFVVHPTVDFVEAGKLGILDASRVLLFQKEHRR